MSKPVIQLNKMSVTICVRVFYELLVNKTWGLKHPQYPVIQHWKTENGIRSYIELENAEFISLFSNIAK